MKEMSKLCSIVLLFIISIGLTQCSNKGSSTDTGEVSGTWQWSKTPTGGGALFVTFGRGESEEDVVSIDYAPAGVAMNLASGTYQVEKEDDKYPRGKLLFFLDNSNQYTSEYLLQSSKLYIDGELYNKVDTANGGRVSGQVRVGSSATETSSLAPNVERTVIPSSGSASRVVASSFVPGEVIVKYRSEPGPVTSLSALSLDGEEAPKLSLKRTKLANGRYKFEIPKPEAPAGVQGLSAVLSQKATWTQKTIEAVREIRKLRENDSNIQYVYPNYLMKNLSNPVSPNDEIYNVQWGHQMVNLANAWGITTGQSQPVVVAVLDSGWINHPDLPGRFYGYDFISLSCTAETRSDGTDTDPNSGCSRDGNVADEDPTDPGDDAMASVVEYTGRASSYHGAHVAGIIGARGNNSSGMAGVNWGVRLMPIRVTGLNGSGTIQDVMSGMQYAAGIGAVVPPQVADVMNMSLGDPLLDERGDAALEAREDLTSVVETIRARGIIIVAAAGNISGEMNFGTPFYPAAIEGVVGVCSITRFGKYAESYSYRGPHCDIAAPGGDGGIQLASTIHPFATSPGEPPLPAGYGALNGTSQAAPFVTGALSLMISAAREFGQPDDADLIVQALYDTARDLGDPGRDDRYGHGLLDVGRAVARAGGQELPTSDNLLLSTSSITMIPAFVEGSTLVPPADEADIFVFGGLSGALSVSATTASGGSWLSATVIGTDQIRVRINREALENGEYSGSVRLVSGSRQATLNVTTIVDDTVSAGASSEADALLGEIERLIGEIEELKANNIDVGTVYVMLVEKGSNEIKYMVETSFAADYRFLFAGVQKGNYTLHVGTNDNQSTRICDDGDICVAYPSLSSPEPLKIDPSTVITDISVSYSK